MEGIVTLVFVIIMIVVHIIKAIKESTESAKPQPQPEEEFVIIAQPKPGKKTKANKQRSLIRQPLEDTADDFAQPKRQSLSKRLTPQGEGERFESDPGTLNAARIVVPTIDPAVKPELESITGIYEEGAVFTDRAKPTITLNIADLFAKPEGIIQAVILAEILNRPIWQKKSDTERTNFLI